MINAQPLYRPADMPTVRLHVASSSSFSDLDFSALEIPILTEIVAERAPAQPDQNTLRMVAAG